MTGRDVNELLRVESSHTCWFFDRERMEFLRVSRREVPESPEMAEGWEPYHDLELDLDSGAFTVSLNAERTRLLRSWRDDGVHASSGSLTERSTS